MIQDYPIDIVYLWCDSHDETWNALCNDTAKKCNVRLRNSANGPCRYSSHDELRYSLRSVETYAPWIRNIFILVDEDAKLPQWLNVDNPRLHVIRHSTIMPQEYLPCFSSVTIEYHICNIPALSEHFLYANDDMLFLNHVKRDFFFDDLGEPVVRMLNAELPSVFLDYYVNTLVNSYKLVLASHPNLSNEKASLMRHMPHHNIDAYRKSHFLMTVQRYSHMLESRFKFPFRARTDFQRMLILWEEMAEYDAPCRIMFPDSQYAVESIVVSGQLRRRGLTSLINNKIKLICFNDTQYSKSDDYVWLSYALDVLYPNPSQFERKLK